MLRIQEPIDSPAPEAVAAGRPDRPRITAGWLALPVGLAFAIGAAVLVWAMLRHEQSSAQQRLEAELIGVAQALRGRLLHDAQAVQLAAGDPRAAADPHRVMQRAVELLADRGEVALIERRDRAGQPREARGSPVARSLAAALAAGPLPYESAVGRSTALHAEAAAFSGGYYVPLPNAAGVEVIDLWVPLEDASALNAAGQAPGEAGATLRVVYVLSMLLAEHVPAEFARGHELLLTEADGSVVARHSRHGRGAGVYRARALLDLPGPTFVLRADALRAAPGLIPNLLTGLVIALSGALLVALARLARDMRRRAQAEAALRDAYAFRQAMEDSLVTGLRARDLQGRITYVNPAFCEMVGLSASELVGRQPPMPYWAPEAIDEYRQRHAQVLAGTVTRHGHESVWMRRDGERFPVLIYEAALIDADGRQTGWMSSVLDLSDRRRVEELARQQHEKLQQAARMVTMGELATVLSHELNQPLAAISSYATGASNLLGASPPEASALRRDLADALERIAAQAQRAGRVVHRVNHFMRRRALHPERLDASEVVSALQPLIELQARKAAVRLRLELSTAPAPVVADRVMLEQAVLNLTRNGIEAMASMPEERRTLELRVVCRDADASVRIEVADLGHGIATEVAERLFTPFFTTKADGLGMGLSLCRSIAEQGGGRLWHEPREAVGTVFVLALPQARP